MMVCQIFQYGEGHKIYSDLFFLPFLLPRHPLVPAVFSLHTASLSSPTTPPFITILLFLAMFSVRGWNAY
jgi:hypothetical protein